ncbi:3-hydroxyisobutyrate dehydrogenase [soil metagenome]
MSTSVAFLGLGHMGLPMAVNLIAAGFEVTGFDPMPAAVTAAGEAGIPVAATAVEAAGKADVVITMLPSGRHVIDAYQGQDGLLAAAKPGTLFIDSSTIAVDDARTAHELAVAAGHVSVDAPVSGGVGGATAGTLAFMVGGSAEDFARAQPVLQPMAGRIVHCGDSGAGQAAKVCNNLILGISMIAVSEAFVLGEKLGLTHQALFDVASNASGQCWALTTNCPVPGLVPTSPANHDYQPGFSGALMAKDLGLAQQAMESSGVHSEVGTLASAIYRRFADGEGAGLDFSAIITDIRDRSAA